MVLQALNRALLSCSDMVRLLTVTLLLLSFTTGLAQQVASQTRLGLTFFSLSQLATGLQSELTVLGNSAVLRTGFGIMTVWLDEAEYMWRPAGAAEPVEGRLGAPTVNEAGEVWAPLELITVMGGTVSGVVVVMPDRSRLVLGAAPADEAPVWQPAAASQGEVLSLADGVQALRLTASDQSVMLVDLGLLALAQPGQRAQLDAFNAGLEGFRPVFFTLSSSVPAEPVLNFSFSQSGVATTLTPPHGLVVLAGDEQAVAPGQPLSGVLLLPEATNLREALQVEWNQLKAQMVFRR